MKLNQTNAQKLENKTVFNMVVDQVDKDVHMSVGFGLQEVAKIDEPSHLIKALKSVIVEVTKNYPDRLEALFYRVDVSRSKLRSITPKQVYIDAVTYLILDRITEKVITRIALSNPGIKET